MNPSPTTPPLKLRRLGASGLLVSPVCLGTMTFGTPVPEKGSIELVHAAIDLGINFVDTANVYEGYRRYLGSPGGVAEEIVGKALRDRRDKVVLATKVGAPLGPGPQDRGLSASHILREVNRSLRRLQTDYIDLYIIHWPDRHVPPETTLAAIDQCVRQGKVRYFGASNHSAWQLCELRWLAERHGWPLVVSSQIPFSLLRREFQYDLTFCEQYDVGVTPYQILQGGQELRRSGGLLDGAEATIIDNVKVGFVGRNGAGKSTLLRVCSARKNSTAAR
jgi:aryl-alcohol dehydrogenase-like predicted oxidoreductase